MCSGTVKKQTFTVSHLASIVQTDQIYMLKCKQIQFVIDRVKSKDKSDRATTEQVMDPRTRTMLFKMISRQLFAEVNGCISTGKEANVYHARRADGTERAIKVYCSLSLC